MRATENIDERFEKARKPIYGSTDLKCHVDPNVPVSQLVEALREDTNRQQHLADTFAKEYEDEPWEISR